MPFPAETAVISVTGEYPRVGLNTLQVFDSPLAAISLADPVVNPMLRWNSSCQQGSPGRRADGGSAEEVIQQHTLCGHAIHVGGAYLRITVASGRPLALIVRKNED